MVSGDPWAPPSAPLATPMPARPGRWHLAFVMPAILVFVLSLALDVRGLMPGLGFWDTGEFQTLGPVLGIAHPTGYPTYTLLLWVASVVLQPFGDPAFRANLLSALLISGAGALAAIAVVQLTRRAVIGLAAGLLLVVAPIPWRNALRADPHPLHLFLTALVLVLLLEWAARHRSRRPHAGRWLVAASFAFGLAVGNHALTLLLAPGVGVFILLVAPDILWRQGRLVLTCLAMLTAATVLVYAYIPLRAAMLPPLDYAHPTTWDRFRYLVLGEQFQGTFRPMPSLAEGARRIWEQLQANLGLVAPLVLGGAVVGCLRRFRVVVLTGAWFFLTWSFALGYENAEIERYYLVPLLVGVLWAALAVDGAWSAVVWAWGRARSRSRWGSGDTGAQRSDDRVLRAAITVLLAGLLVVPVLLPVPDRSGEVDRSRDTSARVWLDQALAALPQDAVVVSWWYYSTALWYGRWVEDRRPDITIIDDRTILDEGLGDATKAVAKYLGTRPVFVIRLDKDLDLIRADYELEPLPGGPPSGRIWRVVPPEGLP